MNERYIGIELSPLEQALERDAIDSAVLSLRGMGFRKGELKRIRKQVMKNSEVSEATFLTTLNTVAVEMSSDESLSQRMIKAILKSRSVVLDYKRPIDVAATLNGPHELLRLKDSLYQGRMAYLSEHLRDNPEALSGFEEEI